VFVSTATYTPARRDPTRRATAAVNGRSDQNAREFPEVHIAQQVIELQPLTTKLSGRRSRPAGAPGSAAELFTMIRALISTACVSSALKPVLVSDPDLEPLLDKAYS